MRMLSLFWPLRHQLQEQRLRPRDPARQPALCHPTSTLRATAQCVAPCPEEHMLCDGKFKFPIYSCHASAIDQLLFLTESSSQVKVGPAIPACMRAPSCLSCVLEPIDAALRWKLFHPTLAAILTQTAPSSPLCAPCLQVYNNRTVGIQHVVEAGGCLILAITGAQGVCLQDSTFNVRFFPRGPPIPAPLRSLSSVIIIPGRPCTAF